MGQEHFATRSKRIRLPACLCVALALIALPARSEKVVLLVRHAEKGPTDDVGAGPSLTATGEMQAMRLCAMLRSAGISEIITSEKTRTKQTAAPLAKALRLEPTVIPRGDNKKVVEEINRASENAVILVVGHSTEHPALCTKLGAQSVPSGAFSVYGSVVVLVRCADAPTWKTLPLFRFDDGGEASTRGDEKSGGRERPAEASDGRR